VYSWNGKIYSVAGTKIYSNSTDLGVTLSTSTGICQFAESRPSAATQYLSINDGEKLYQITTGDVVTTVTAIPTPNTRDLIYFDGYLFTMKTDGTIWNCALDDPSTWAGDAFVTAIMQNGVGIGLARQNNYLQIFSDKGMQTFFDNANATGSPLLNIEQGMLTIGCASNNSIRFDESDVTWVGKSQTGGYAVWNLNGISNAREISDPTIERLLNAEGSSISTCRAKMIRTNGHRLYILDLMSANRTLVYDFELNIWYEWQGAGVSTRWPIADTYEFNGDLIAQDESNGWIYTVSPTTYQDNGTSFTTLVRTGRVDFDTKMVKYPRRFYVIGDQQATTTPISVQYSDDDFQTLSTARTIDLVDYNPFVVLTGGFKQRSWQFSYTGANPLRVEAFEMTYRLGTR
jgi:hypothetical protein